MTFREACEKYGHPRDTLAVADKVLVEGSDNGGRYVFLCEVSGINGDNARLREIETYYPSGGVFARKGEIDCPIAYFKASILTIIEAAKEEERLLANKWRKWTK